MSKSKFIGDDEDAKVIAKMMGQGQTDDESPPEVEPPNDEEPAQEENP